MRTQLRESYRPVFASLCEDQVRRVFARLVETWPKDVRPNGHEVTGGDELYEICRGAGLDQARVVLSLARDHDELGCRTIEALVGRPIRPWVPPLDPAVVAAPPAKRSTGSNKRDDTRVVLSVGPNPHAEGSVAHENFKHWVAGATVQECVNAGMRPRPARRNIRQGHVVVGAPR